MNLPDGLIPALWLWLGHAAFGVVLLRALWRAPWWHLRDSESMNIWLGTCVALLLVWSIRVGVAPGLNLHPLGMTLMTLMFGWEFAVIGVALVVLGVTANGGAGWEALSLNALVMGVLPILLSQRLYTLVDRHLPNHFFIYIFVCAFLGAGMSMVVTGLVSTALLVACGAYGAEYVADNYLRFYLLMVFPEAFLTGMLMTALVAYRPQWVSTFDDERYLRHK